MVEATGRLSSLSGTQQVSDREFRGFDTTARALVHAYHEAGWATFMSNRGHVICRAPDGVTTAHVTRSSLRGRSGRNARSDLNRWLRANPDPDTDQERTDKEPDMGTIIEPDTGTGLFLCPDCGKELSHRRGYTLHRISQHDGFTCPECGLRMDAPASARGMSKHREDEHGVLPPSKRKELMFTASVCPVCGRGFANHHGLNGHLKGHSSEERERARRSPMPIIEKVWEPAAPETPEAAEAAVRVQDDQGRVEEWLAGHDPMQLLVSILAVAAPPLIGDLERVRKERDEALAQVQALRVELAETKARLDLIREAMGA